MSLVSKDQHVALLLGKQITIWNGSKAIDIPNAHDEVIRVGIWASSAQYLITAGDDKQVKCWKADGSLVASRKLHKKPSAITIAAAPAAAKCEELVLVGDKFGDVTAFPLPDVAATQKFCLGHTASIITAMTTMKAGGSEMLVSCDRDEKIRISELPHCVPIVSYCLGHEEYITRVVGINSSNSRTESPLVVSGAGDGNVALWDAVSGSELARKSYGTEVLVENGVLGVESSPGVFAPNPKDLLIDDGADANEGDPMDDGEATPEAGEEEKSDEGSAKKKNKVQYKQLFRQLVAVNVMLYCPNAQCVLVSFERSKRLVCLKWLQYVVAGSDGSPAEAQAPVEHSSSAPTSASPSSITQKKPEQAKGGATLEEAAELDLTAVIESATLLPSKEVLTDEVLLLLRDGSLTTLTVGRKSSGSIYVAPHSEQQYSSLTSPLRARCQEAWKEGTVVLRDTVSVAAQEKAELPKKKTRAVEVEEESESKRQRTD